MVNSTDSKTYRSKNLKFIFSFIFLLSLSVVILLYLLSIGNFLPIDINGDYNWINILTVSSLLFLIVFSISTLFIYLLLRIFFKKEDSKYLKIFCIKWGLLFTVGFSLVLILNFLHILNIYWGVGILIVVILTSFII